MHDEGDVNFEELFDGLGLMERSIPMANTEMWNRWMSSSVSMNCGFLEFCQNLKTGNGMPRTPNMSSEDLLKNPRIKHVRRTTTSTESSNEGDPSLEIYDDVINTERIGPAVKKVHMCGTYSIVVSFWSK